MSKLQILKAEIQKFTKSSKNILKVIDKSDSLAAVSLLQNHRANIQKLIDTT